MRSSHAVRMRIGAALAGGAVLLAGCASGTGSAEPTWKPKPSFSGEGYNPPPPSQQPGTQPSQGSPGSPSQSPNGQSGDGAVVAKKLTTPTAIAILPDNTALVGERTTGRIVRVQPEPNHPVQPVRTIPGLSTTGDGGLLDLALSPNYSEDNLIFGYITTKTDNRVVAFTLKGPITPVLTGIPRGRTGNTGRIAFAADGSLYVGTGDAGRPKLAADPTSLAGKILHVTDIGKPATGNPKKGSRIFASALPDVAGLCVDHDTTAVFHTESWPALPADPIYQVTAGATYGFPHARLSDSQPLGSLPTTSRSPGGCAVEDSTIYVTSLDGKALLGSPLKLTTSGEATLGKFTVTLRNKYGRLRTVVAAPDGALWLTTSNRDGNGRPIATDERVLRIVPNGGGGGSNSV